jgi:hypothetical protein
MTSEAVVLIVKRALYSPDPMDRAIASAELRKLRLPVSPQAIVIAAERQVMKAAA